MNRAYKPYGIKSICIVPTCKNKMSTNRSISYFSFPKDVIRCKKWIENCKITEDIEIVYKKQLKICGEHFETKMFLNDLKNRLQPHALPAVFSADEIEVNTSVSSEQQMIKDEPVNIDYDDDKLCTSTSEVLGCSLDSNVSVGREGEEKEEEEITKNSVLSPSTSSDFTLDSSSSLSSLCPSKCVQTPKAWSNKTPKKVLLRQQLKIEKERRQRAEQTVISLSHQLTKLKSPKNILKLCEKHLAPGVMAIVKSNMLCKTRKARGFRYANDMKQLALNIYFLGPSVYRFLQTTLSLPTVRTLRRVTSKYKLTT